MARGLLNDPWILFLDEPTLGLDVAAARSIRELVLDWKARRPRPDGAADDALHGRGRRAVRADRDRRPRPDPRDRHARRAQEARPARVDLPARARPPRRAASRRWPGCPASSPRRSPRTPTRSSQRVAVNLVLEEDAALGGVVTALARHRVSHILALRKSEPTLEDVFVELVGRGFGDEAATATGATAAGTPDGGRATATATGARHRGPAALAQRRRGRGGLPGGGRLMAGRARAAAGEPGRSSRRPATAPTRGRRRLDATPGRREQRPGAGRPRVSRASGAWSASRRGCSSRSCCRSSRRRRSCSSTARCRRPRPTSASSSWAARWRRSGSTSCG